MLNTSLFVLATSLATAQCQTWWKPPSTTSWQIVLSAPLNTSYPSNVTALDGDLFDTTTDTWKALKAQGHKNICYFSAGTYENWRSDADKFNDTDLGDNLDNWPGERWVNTRSTAIRKIMTDRMDLAVTKGCDAIDPDNMDAYDNGGGGLDLTQTDAVDYITFLATEAHNRGMGCGLKNAGAIVSRVVDIVDFQVNEQCVQYQECDKFSAFVAKDKPMFGIEYVEPNVSQATINARCGSPDRPKTFETLVKHMDLGEWYFSCPVQSGCNTTSNATASSACALPFTDAGHRDLAARSTFGLLFVALFMCLS